MERFSRTQKVFFAIVGGFLLLAILGWAWGGKAISEAVKASEYAYTYNIKGTIVSITGVHNPNSTSNPFKYIVCADFEEDVQPDVLSEAPHVLPAISGGRHCLPIPDTDIAGYVDWEASRAIVNNPVDSVGVKMFQYVLRQGVDERLTTFSCHEELGSSGAAELVCSEF